MAMREEVGRERAKVKDLSTKKKLDYIWTYYKLYIIVAVCIVATGLYIYSIMSKAITEHWFFLAVPGTQANVGNGSDLYNGYIDYTGFDLKEKNVDFQAELYFDYSMNKATGNDYYDLFVAYIDSGVLDAAVMDSESLVSFGESGRLLDLDREEVRAIKDKYGDRFLYCVPAKEGYDKDLVPVGIDLTGSILDRDYDLFGKSCALGIGAYSQNFDATLMFLDYIFEE